MKYIPGKENPCDWKSRHSAAIDDLSPRDRDRLGVDDNDDVVVMKILMENVPTALTIEMIQEAATKDDIYQKLKEAIRLGRKPKGNTILKDYTKIWEELSIVNDLVLRGDKIVIPKGNLEGEIGNIRQWIIELGHEGHMGTAAIKRRLRARLWFPTMDKMMEDRSEGCLGCQAATLTPHRDPLQPTTAPQLPFERCSAYHWGPTPEGKYVIVVIDLLTRYPEVAIVEGTSAEDNIHSLDVIFARHFNPKLLLTDGGPPWNTKPSHPLQKYFKSEGIIHKITRAADDPEANGTCEAWMKHLKKIWHVSYVEGKDPIIELNKHLRQVRVTPHPTTGMSPAELLFNRSYRDKLPDMRPNLVTNRSDIVEAREKDKREKERMKKYKDANRNVKAHNIKVGDKVLLERKSTKRKSSYDPDPYEVVEVSGTQIKAKRGRSAKLRDAQKWKVYRPEKRVKFRLPTNNKEARWELEVDASPPAIRAPAPQGGGRRRRIREVWVTRGPREAAPPRRPLLRELRNIAPFLSGGTNAWEEPAQFQGALPSRRSARTRN